MTSTMEAELAALCREHGVDPPRLVWDPGPGDIEFAHLSELLRYWQGLAQDECLPNTRAIDPIELRSLLSNISLVETVDGGRDFRYRVYSTTAAERLGTEFTGRLVSEVGTFSAPLFLATYRAVLERRRPLLTVHVPPRHISVSEWTRLILPLVDDAGAVARFIVGLNAGTWRSSR